MVIIQADELVGQFRSSPDLSKLLRPKLFETLCIVLASHEFMNIKFMVSCHSPPLAAHLKQILEML